MAGKWCIVVLLHAGLLLLLLNPSSVRGQEATNGNEDNYYGRNNPRQCAREFLQWCRRRSSRYSNYIGISTYMSGEYRNGVWNGISCALMGSRVLCFNKRGEPWFYCSRNGILLYTTRLRLLTEDTDDPDVCEAKDRAVGV